jgi:hypothetical protein
MASGHKERKEDTECIGNMSEYGEKVIPPPRREAILYHAETSNSSSSALASSIHYANKQGQRARQGQAADRKGKEDEGGQGGQKLQFYECNTIF